MTPPAVPLSPRPSLVSRSPGVPGAPGRPAGCPGKSAAAPGCRLGSGLRGSPGLPWAALGVRVVPRGAAFGPLSGWCRLAVLGVPRRPAAPTAVP